MKFEIRDRSAVQVIGICVLLAALVWSVFGQTARFQFINFDDTQVYQTPEVTRGLTLGGIVWAFMHGQGGSYIPLSTLSHMLDCQLCGLWAGGHHLTNVLLHAVVAILLFLVLRRMTGALWRSAFVAAFFAVHPLRVESVAWVTERKDVLSGIFFMLTLWAYTRYTRHPESRGSYAMVLVWFALGLMSKSMLVTVPVILILLDYWPLGRLQNPSQLRALLKEKLPLFALSILSCVAAVLAAREGVQPIEHLSFFPRVCNALIAYVIYLGLLIHPSELAVYYPLAKGGAGAWQVIGACLLLAALTAVAWVLRRKNSYFLVGWLWYLGMLVPVIGIVQVGAQAYADRFTYLPQIGICIAATWAAADWAEGCWHRQVVLAAMAMVALSVLSLAAWRQTGFWRDSVTLFTHTLECTGDNYIARSNLGLALLDQGRTGEAVDQCREALRIYPNQWDAHLNLGTALLQQGLTDEAISEYRAALRITPGTADVHNALGNALSRQGSPQEALAEYRHAVRIDTTDPDAQYNLGIALYRQGLIDEAIGHYLAAAQINPASEAIHDNLGNAFYQQGRLDEAIDQYRAALRINPSSVNAQNNLGAALLRQGQTAEAIQHFQKALELKPGNVAILNTLASVLATAPQASLRNGPRALQLALQASHATGGSDPNILRTLAAAYAEAGKYQDAIRTAQRALQVAVNADLVGTLRQDIKLYETGHPLPDGQ